jgi:hypothetical protein
VAQRQGGYATVGVDQKHCQFRLFFSAWATSARLMTSR